MDVTEPYILGFAGRAAAGKTAAATAIAPTSQVILEEDELGGGDRIFWTKLSFATPIRQILSARQKISGENTLSRQCHQVHEIVRVLVGSLVSYDELVELVYDICSYPVPEEGKPREFMQWVGDALREIHPDTFVRWMARQVRLDFSDFRKDYPREKETDEDWVPPAFGVVIDDVRFPNEVDYIVSQANGFMVRLEVSTEQANRRLMARDGHAMSFAQMAHVSENALNSVAPATYAAIIDTDQHDVPSVVKLAMDSVFPPTTVPIDSVIMADQEVLFNKLITGIR